MIQIEPNKYVHEDNLNEYTHFAETFPNTVKVNFAGGYDAYLTRCDEALAWAMEQFGPPRVLEDFEDFEAYPRWGYLSSYLMDCAYFADENDAFHFKLMWG